MVHLGYSRTEFVARQRWLSGQDCADLLALWLLDLSSQCKAGDGEGVADDAASDNVADIV